MKKSYLVVVMNGVTTALISGISLGGFVTSYAAPDSEPPEAPQVGTSGQTGNAPKPTVLEQVIPNAPSTPVAQPNPNNALGEEIIDSLILVDESPYQVLHLLERLTGKVALMGQDLPPVKINLNLKGSMPKREAIVALESVLSLNGISVTEMGERFIKAYPIVKAKNQAPEFLTGSSLDMLPNQKIYSKLFKLNYMTIMDAAIVVYPLITPGTGSIASFEKANAILVTDTLTNIQNLERLFAKVDCAPTTEDSLRFFPLKNVGAAELQRHLRQLQETSLKRYFKNNTTFEADERTNQLMVMTPSSNLPLVEMIINKFDIDVAPLTRTEVFYIKHAEAVAVSDLVRKIITGQQEKAKESREKGNKLETQPQSPFGRPFTTTPQPTASTGENAQFSKSAAVEADERSNAVVAYGTPTDLRQIKDLIDKIDITLTQVRIDVVIAEVTLTKGNVSGLSNFGIDYNMAKPNKLGKVNISNANATDAVKNREPILINALSFNKKFAFDTIFHTAKADSNVRLLSSPSITTTHNKPALVEIGEERPTISSSQTTPPTGTASSPTVTQNVTYKSITLTLNIKPLIGGDGIVQMDIEQSFDSPRDNDPNALNQIVVGKRKAKSFISVADGETIILAGLQERQTSKSKNKMFFLGDIPVIGDALFTQKQDTVTTKELIIFIRPQIIYLPTDAKAIDENKAKSLQLKDDLDYYFKEGKFKDVSDEKTLEEKKAAKEALDKSKSKKLPKRELRRLKKQSKEGEAVS